MTREEARDVLKAYLMFDKSSQQVAKALDMAIEALSADAVEGKESGSKLDVISRELAMERIANDNVVGGMERINEYNNSTEFNEYLDGISDAITTIFCDVPSAEAEWIPCSERLPEEEGWYLVTIQNDKTEKRRTENDLFAIGIAEAHKLTPYKFCKDGHRQTVIAWMPIPKPYREEKQNG